MGLKIAEIEGNFQTGDSAERVLDIEFGGEQASTGRSLPERGVTCWTSWKDPVVFKGTGNILRVVAKSPRKLLADRTIGSGHLFLSSDAELAAGINGLYNIPLHSSRGEPVGEVRMLLTKLDSQPASPANAAPMAADAQTKGAIAKEAQAALGGRNPAASTSEEPMRLAEAAKHYTSTSASASPRQETYANTTTNPNPKVGPNVNTTVSDGGNAQPAWLNNSQTRLVGSSGSPPGGQQQVCSPSRGLPTILGSPALPASSSSSPPAEDLTSKLKRQLNWTRTSKLSASPPQSAGVAPSTNMPPSPQQQQPTGFGVATQQLTPQEQQLQPQRAPMQDDSARFMTPPQPQVQVQQRGPMQGGSDRVPAPPQLPSQLQPQVQQQQTSMQDGPDRNAPPPPLQAAGQGPALSRKIAVAALRNGSRCDDYSSSRPSSSNSSQSGVGGGNAGVGAAGIGAPAAANVTHVVLPENRGGVRCVGGFAGGNGGGGGVVSHMACSSSNGSTPDGSPRAGSLPTAAPGTSSGLAPWLQPVAGQQPTTQGITNTPASSGAGYSNQGVKGAGRSTITYPSGADNNAAGYNAPIGGNGSNGGPSGSSLASTAGAAAAGLRQSPRRNQQLDAEQQEGSPQQAAPGVAQHPTDGGIHSPGQNLRMRFGQQESPPQQAPQGFAHNPNGGLDQSPRRKLQLGAGQQEGLPQQAAHGVGQNTNGGFNQSPQQDLRLRSGQQEGLPQQGSQGFGNPGGAAARGGIFSPSNKPHSILPRNVGDGGGFASGGGGNGNQSYLVTSGGSGSGSSFTSGAGNASNSSPGSRLGNFGGRSGSGLASRSAPEGSFGATPTFERSPNASPYRTGRAGPNHTSYGGGSPLMSGGSNQTSYGGGSPHMSSLHTGQSPRGGGGGMQPFAGSHGNASTGTLPSLSSRQSPASPVATMSSAVPMVTTPGSSPLGRRTEVTSFFESPDGTFHKEVHTTTQHYSSAFNQTTHSSSSSGLGGGAAGGATRNDMTGAITNPLGGGGGNGGAVRSETTEVVETPFGGTVTTVQQDGNGGRRMTTSSTGGGGDSGGMGNNEYQLSHAPMPMPAPIDMGPMMPPVSPMGVPASPMGMPLSPMGVPVSPMVPPVSPFGSPMMPPVSPMDSGAAPLQKPGFSRFSKFGGGGIGAS